METTKEKTFTAVEVVEKLIGKIQPVGSTETDAERLENLKVMCELVDQLVSKIDYVAYSNRDSHESSVVKCADYAKKFISETLGIA